MNDILIPLKVETDGDFSLSADTGQNITIGVDTVITTIAGEHYQGPYEVTPAQVPQILPTSGKAMDGNVVVTAIPSNYGLIEWDGSALRIS